MERATRSANKGFIVAVVLLLCLAVYGAGKSGFLLRKSAAVLERGATLVSDGGDDKISEGFIAKVFSGWKKRDLGSSSCDETYGFLLILGAIVGGGVLFLATILHVGFSRKRSSASTFSKVERFLDDYANEMPVRYSFSQLKKITNNFADKLGEGGFGVVYKGKLPRGNLVAVKILNQSRHSETQFMNEVATIGRIHHVHLIRLMGYCFDGSRSGLVYEYMVNGSLEKLIFAGKEKEGILNLEQLYSIALGSARGIAYLHQECNGT